MKTLGNWKAYLYNKAGAFEAELPYEAISITRELNNIAVATINVSYFILNEWTVRQGLTTDNLLSSGFKSVSITRNNVVMFKGILSEISMDGSGEDIKLNLTFKNWLAYFQKRLITKSYTNTDAGLIAWDIINTNQGVTNGSIGITKGTVVATTNRDRSYADDESALSITRLSANELSGGFDFEITDEKVFNVYSRIGSDKPAIVFDEINVLNWNVVYSVGLNLTNNVLVLGNEISATRNSTGTRQADWYLLSEKLSHTSVIETATLNSHGDALLALKQDVTRVPTITVTGINYDITDYIVGDKVTVKLGGVINGLYRISSKQIDISAEAETSQLKFL